MVNSENPQQNYNRLDETERPLDMAEIQEFADINREKAFYDDLQRKAAADTGQKFTPSFPADGLELWSATSTMADTSTDLDSFRAAVTSRFQAYQSRSEQDPTSARKAYHMESVLKMTHNPESVRGFISKENVLKQKTEFEKKADEAATIDVPDARQEVDRSFELERLLDEAVQLSKGSVILSMYGNSKTVARVVEHAQKAGRITGNVSGQNGGVTIGELNTRTNQLDRSVPSGVERIMFAPRKENITKEIIEEVQVTSKGLLGKKSVTEQRPKTVVVGERTVEHKEVVGAGNGKDEPSVRVVYSFMGNNTMPWVDPDTRRTGNQMVVGFDVPETLANELRSRIQQDPTVARDLAARIALGYAYPEDLWNNGLGEDNDRYAIRPPYDKLPDSHKLEVVDLASTITQRTGGKPAPTIEIPFS